MREHPDIDRYWSSLEARLPTFAADEQRAAVALYRELANGDPVSVERLAEALGVTASRAGELLERPCFEGFVYPDEEGHVLGFGGLAAAPTPMGHRLELDGRTLWTWCAWDGLFIPEILGERAVLVSTDPETGGQIRVAVTPGGVESVDPETAVISFVLPDADLVRTSAENVMARFCHFVFLFESRRSGERRVARHEGMFLCEIDEAVALARRLNARNFGSVLGSASARTLVDGAGTL